MTDGKVRLIAAQIDGLVVRRSTPPSVHGRDFILGRRATGRGLLRGRQLEQRLELHREHRISRDAKLALEVELHAEIRIDEHLQEVFAGNLDDALSLASVAADAGRRITSAIDGPFTAT